MTEAAILQYISMIFLFHQSKCIIILKFQMILTPLRVLKNKFFKGVLIMKKKIMFFMVTILALSCLFVTASASTIDDVIFKKGDAEVFTVGAGAIRATVNVSVDTDTPTPAALVTAAYENDRLQSIQWEGITLTPNQKVYEGTAVTATADTTNVDVMVWGLPSYSPIDTKESLTNVSRQIKVSDFSVTANGNTFKGVVNNAQKTVIVEQIVDIYKNTNHGTAYSKFYNERPLDFPSLTNATANYKFNGTDKTGEISLALNSPATISLEAPNGRKADYTVSVEQHVAGVVANMDYNNNPTFDTSTANRIRINSNQSVCQFTGTSRYGGGAIDVTCLTSGHDIHNYQDTELDAYYNVSFEQRSEGNNYLKTVKYGNTGGGPAIHLYDGGSNWGTDKTVFSFDFKCDDLNATTALQPMVMGTGSLALMLLNFEKKSNADAVYLTYVSDTADGKANGFGGYGKRLAEIPFDQWVNVKLIVDRDAEKPFIVCLNDEVLLETSYTAYSNSGLPATFSGNVLRLGTYSSANTTVCLDNIMMYCSQAKPAA